MPSKKEVKFLLAERDRLAEFGRKFDLLLTGFDHFGSPYCPTPNASFCDSTDTRQTVTLPYWMIRHMEGGHDAE